MLIAGNEDVPTRNNFALGKIDYNASTNQTFSATYNFDKGYRSPYGILGDVGALGTESLKHVVATKWTSVLSGTSVNELNVGYSDSRPSGDLPISDFDFIAAGMQPFRSNRDKVGEFVVPGLSGVGYRVDGSFYRQRAYTFKDGFSQSRGNHSLRLGGEYTYYTYDVVLVQPGLQRRLGVPQHQRSSSRRGSAASTSSSRAASRARATCAST